jgi:hypothetical protein
MLFSFSRRISSEKDENARFARRFGHPRRNDAVAAIAIGEIEM